MKNKNFSSLFANRKKCVIYIRVSSERQVQGFSLDGQKRELMEYAKAKGLEVAVYSTMKLPEKSIRIP